MLLTQHERALFVQHPMWVQGSPSPKFPPVYSFCAAQRVDLQEQMSFGRREDVPMYWR